MAFAGIVPLLATGVLATTASGSPAPQEQPGHWWSLWPELFLAPGRLWLLLLIPVLIAVYVWRQFRRRRYAVRFSAAPLLATLAPRRPGWRRHVVAGGLVLALTVLIVGFARPAGTVREPRDRATVILAIDTSLSMDATDVPPSRLRAAQQAAREFALELPPGMNLGLVSFSGSATVVVPPTTDRQRVIRGIDGLTLGPYTAIGEGIAASLQAIKLAPLGNDDEPVPAHIVLLSDGETTAGRSNGVAALEAAQAEVPVSTIGFGTPTGTVTIEGFSQPVPVNEDDLRSISEATDGTFYEAQTLDQLTEVYDDIRHSVGYELVPSEITDRWLGLGLLLLLATAIGSLGWFGRLP
ncbi:MAG: VWA domain-containing protein [Actinomycetales bacterium]